MSGGGGSRPIHDGADGARRRPDHPIKHPVGDVVDERFLQRQAPGARQRRTQAALLDLRDDEILRRRLVEPAIVALDDLREVRPRDRRLREHRRQGKPRAIDAQRMDFEEEHAVLRRRKVEIGIDLDVVRALRRRAGQGRDERESGFARQHCARPFVFLDDHAVLALTAFLAVLHLQLADGGAVNRGEVILLHRVLHVDLPVARDDPLDRARAAEIREAVRADALVEVPQPFAEPDRVAVEVHEDESAPGLEPDFRQAVVRQLESLDVLHAAGAAEASGGVVGPAVIGASERSRVARPLEHLGPAMAAGVRQRAQRPVETANDDDRNAGHVDAEIVPGLGQALDPTDGVPGPREDGFDFAPVEGLGRIGPGRKRLRFLQRKAHLLVVGRIEDVAGMHAHDCLQLFFSGAPTRWLVCRRSAMYDPI